MTIEFSIIGYVIASKYFIFKFILVSYFQEYLSNCLDAIYEDKVNLKGYMVWSIIDDWEWSGGYK